MAENLCGNADHPRGPWHELAPWPFSWQYRIRLFRWARKKRWDCACPRDARVPGVRRG